MKNLINAWKTMRSTFKYLILSLIALIQLFPLYWLFSFSLKNNVEIFGKNIWSVMGPPTVFRWNNYVNVLQNSRILMYLWNSVIVVAVTILISTVLATMASYAIARMKWKLSNGALLVFLSGMMIPTQAILVPLLIMMRSSGVYDTYWALILPNAALAMPMAVFVFVGFLKTIPRELEEAACIDGMSIYGIFMRIMIPLIRPAIATIAIFTYLGTWNELMFAITLVSGGDAHKTITAGVQQLAGRYYSDWGKMGAGLALATIPTLIIYTLLSKQIQKSFTTGALKG